MNEYPPVDIEFYKFDFLILRARRAAAWQSLNRQPKAAKE
jgi:hypothetical protein